MRTNTQRPRRKWPWILGTAIAVIALIVGASIWYGSGQSASNQTAPESVAPSATVTSTADSSAVIGCPGGAGFDSAMVLAAQKSAPHSQAGAVELAAAAARWAYQYPYPSAADSDTVSASVVDAGASAKFKDLKAFFATNPNVSGGLVPDATAYHLSTVQGVWHVESYSANQASVSIGTGIVVSGALSPTLRISVTVPLTWENNAWHFGQLVGTRTAQDLFSIGTPFEGGC